MPKPSVLIADDHALFREGVRAICETLGNFEVTGEARTGHEAVVLARKLCPDIILMDIHMPELDGVSAAEQIIRHDPEAKVVMLTMFNQESYLFDAVKAGARGYILKDASGEELVAAVQAVMDGDISLPGQMAVKVLNAFRQMSRDGQNDLDRLTPAEMEVLKQVARGWDNRRIASELAVSEKTVSNRLSEIFSKLGVTNRTQAALTALRRGWVSLYPEEGSGR